MWNFKEDLAKWEEMEKQVIDILNNDWYLILKNPDTKGIDLLVIEKWIEVKFDVSSYKYWNFYIEFECYWKPSGIFKNEWKIKLKYWAHSDWEILILLEWKKLHSFITEKISECRKNKSLSSKGFRIVENWGDGGRSKGLLVPKEDLKKQAKKIYILKKQENEIL